MSTKRSVTWICKRQNEINPYRIIEGLAGEYLGYLWVLPDYLIIEYIKHNIEQYYVSEKGKKIKVILGFYNGNEYLKTDQDGDSPDILLQLPTFDTDDGVFFGR